ncbi:MarR family winged helix-turn-helix transcriptional regulator [Chloroflexota bacterium]
MQQAREALVQRILKLSEDIFSVLSPGIPAERLSSEITVAQLRVLLVLQSRGASRMSDIASGLDVALSTATGVVDHLVRKGLVEREDDPQDRRLVICRLSDTGQQLIDSLWLSGQSQMERLLDGLTSEQLEKAAEVARMLFNNVSGKTGTNSGGKTK